MTASGFSPKGFLRSRRPERFSDSVLEDAPVLDRSMLEYHLQSLTSRNQEQDFEEFARHLAEKEICPNLIPHTGPTGGGDSKVDSETYPVADQLSLGWFTGLGREGGSERWAFAFSAKKTWRSKVQSDIKKIGATRRGYKKAFFVTNQFVPDRTRAQVEDTLRKKYRIDVRIFDLNWILDRVFAGKHEEMAIRELRIATTKPLRIRKGPLDTEREQDLEDAEERVLEALQENRLDLTLVEASIETALLARELERPRTEIDGRFDRASRLAAKHGTHEQQVECAYQRAWTAFWWFEDFTSFAEFYTDVETHVRDSNNPYDLERLSNLWSVLNASTERGDIPAASAHLERRTATLVALLEHLSGEKSRPSAALQAEALLIQARLMLDSSSANSAFVQFEDVVRRSEGLVGFPLQPLADVLTELGRFFGEIREYEKLYDTLIEVTTKRSGEVHAARMLLKRGAQQLDASRPYEAIRSLGRALRKLYKHESRRDLVRALYLCGSAYEKVGLLWAARGTLLMAGWIATSEFSTYGNITPLQAACYQRLKWVELQLGRIPQALEWYELDRLIRNILATNGYDKQRLFADEVAFDGGLGVLFLKSDIETLATLADFPDALERLDLSRASLALMFALGHEDRARDELAEVVPADKLLAFFSQWRGQPISQNLPMAASPSEERRTVLRSRVLGCRLQVDTDYTFPSLDLAESILAATESFLATGLEHKLFGREPTLQIDIRKSDFAALPFEFTSSDREGRPYFEVRCASFASDNIGLELQTSIRERLFELIAEIIGRIVILRDPAKTLQALFEDELVLERALHFTTSFVVSTNILGPTPKRRLGMWTQPGDRHYALLRQEAWYAGSETEAPPEISSEETPIKFGTGDPPEELRNMHQTRHNQVHTVSLIRESLWARAKWSGTAFIVDLSNQLPPILAPIFTDAQAARDIFSQWQKELGSVDRKEQLRVTIIRRISRAKPMAYRVTIGTSMEAAELKPTEIGFFLSRSNTMEPTTLENLDRFLRSHEALGEYLLAPAVLGLGGEPRLSKISILKRELFVREAWQIGRHDPDASSLSGDDDPIIPPEVTDAPVIDLLNWLRGQNEIGT